MGRSTSADCHRPRETTAVHPSDFSRGAITLRPVRVVGIYVRFLVRDVAWWLVPFLAILALLALAALFEAELPLFVYSIF